MIRSRTVRLGDAPSDWLDMFRRDIHRARRRERLRTALSIGVSAAVPTLTAAGILAFWGAR